MSGISKRFKRCPFCGQLNELNSEICNDCKRPLAKTEIVEMESKDSLDNKPSVIIERFDKREDKDISAKEIPHLELESAADVLSRSVFGREETVTKEQTEKKKGEARISSDEVNFKLVDLKSDEFRSARVGSDGFQQESSELPKDTITSTYEELQKKKRAQLEEIRRKELEYWRKIRFVEQFVIFISRVVPWFVMASLIAFIIVPFVSSIFPQGTWEGHIFDSVRSVAFKMELSREGNQLVGTLQFLDEGWVRGFPFVLEGVVWDINAPLRVRGSFKPGKISLAIFPEESETKKIILSGKWTRKKASGDAQNFWGINAKWDMEKL